MDDLALQVAGIDEIEIDEPKRPDPRRGEIQRRRRSQSTRADEHHARALEFRLAFETYIRKREVPGIPQQLLMRQRCQFPAAAPAI